MSEWREFELLGVAVLLGFFQLLWAAAAARRQQGLKWARGPRDEARPITGVAARLDRAFRNYMETFPLFAAAVLAVLIGGRTGTLSYWGASLYVIARILYVPLYAFGVPLRTLVWFVSIIGFLMVASAIFLPTASGL